MGDSTVVDSMVKDGLWCACEDWHMGMTGELVAEKHGITREMQDAYALESHRRASAAWREGRFDAEVVPVAVPSKKKGGEPVIVSRDESVRDDASLEALAALKPAFKKDGTVTAGNAPGVNDAAAAVVVMSAAKAKSLGTEADGDDQGAGDERRCAEVGDAGSGDRRAAGFERGRVGRWMRWICLS